MPHQCSGLWVGSYIPRHQEYSYRGSKESAVQRNSQAAGSGRTTDTAGLHRLLLLHGGLEREVSWSELWSHGWNVRRWRPTRVGRKVRVRRVGPESSGSWEEAARKNKKGSAVDMTTVTLQNNVSINFKNDSGEPRVFNCLY